jgi:hypothetical protein
LFRKTTVNYIRKKSKKCQPKSGKDIPYLSGYMVTAVTVTVFFFAKVKDATCFHK